MRIKRFNEDNSWEKREMEDILNIARDEGLLVTISPVYHSHGDTSYKISDKIIISRSNNPFGGHQESSSSKFLRTIKEIYQRLENLGIIYTNESDLPKTIVDYGSYIGTSDVYTKYFYFENYPTSRAGKFGRRSDLMIDEADPKKDDFTFAYIYVKF